MNKFSTVLSQLADQMSLGALMNTLQASFGGFELLNHWTQGEFHHDLVFRLGHAELPEVIVVSTNCNGGVKDVLGFLKVPERFALWHFRCPDNEEFDGEIPDLVGQARTTHWFHPCEILVDNARSELKPEHRKRQKGGGWEPI